MTTTRRRPTKFSMDLFCVWPNFDVRKASYLRIPGIVSGVDYQAPGREMSEKVTIGADAWEALVTGLEIFSLPEDRHETWLRRGNGERYETNTTLFLCSFFFCRERIRAIVDALLGLEPFPSTHPITRSAIKMVLTKAGGLIPAGDEGNGAKNMAYFEEVDR
ncbi:hypothetical protein LB557_18855 [Mesorhizobium sp. BR115XR7A]|uniref:hypothetical protein n=1 Tax=Mesorhizobium sp. BR115XR7A TaxID=2876645 RepID=UPI001CCD17D2|nr:hypothetical protein [Mesorhizobium sp. BR115XR7A]MBZ9908074.1 hypothetical protein [Mesorhizobium sp. BR115XR7A]MBZ9931382.1 hypothetical protein [Mesorhizobium sp. BR1-1-5]